MLSSHKGWSYRGELVPHSVSGSKAVGLAGGILRTRVRALHPLASHLPSSPTRYQASRVERALPVHYPLPSPCVRERALRTCGPATSAGGPRYLLRARARAGRSPTIPPPVLRGTVHSRSGGTVQKVGMRHSIYSKYDTAQYSIGMRHRASYRSRAQWCPFLSLASVGCA